MEKSILDNLGGATKPTKYESLYFAKSTGGYQTQRSPFTPIDTRGGAAWFGSRAETLIAGSNVEVNNAMNLQRRPGLLAYGSSSIPAPLTYFSYQTIQIPTQPVTSANNLQLIVDSSDAVRVYSTTATGIILNKSTGGGQTSFYTLSNTMYFSNGVDQYKYTGANLLSYSNTFSNAIWSHLGTTSITAGQADPNGGTNATAVVFNTTGSSATSYILQKVSQTPLAGGVPSTPLNYMPVSQNTFTFSVWMKSSNAGDTIFLQMTDSTGAVIINTQQTLTTGWVKYQVTATASMGATGVTVLINDPSSSSHTYYIYGAQLEVGGPATPTVITTNKSQGVWLWGIQAPTSQPTFTFGTPSVNVWQPGHSYSIGNTVVDANGNLQTATTSGTSGSAPPTWNTVAGNTTLDGQQNQVVQTAFSSSTNGSNVTVTLPLASTTNNAILVFIAYMNAAAVVNSTVSDTQSNTYTKFGNNTAGQLSVVAYYSLAITGGSAFSVTVANASSTSSLLWVGIAEVSGLTATDGANSNAVPNGSVSSQFNTGSITTTNASDIIVSFAAFENSRGLTYQLGTIANNANGAYVPVVSQNSLTSRSNGNKFEQCVAVLQYISTTQTLNPTWSVANGVTDSWMAGVTGAFKSSVGTLKWTNGGQTSGTGLSPSITGFSYYYSFVNTATGHRSGVSPISFSTGLFTGQTVVLSGSGCKIPTSGTGAATGTGDPQVDAIEVYRNTDGSAFYLQIPPSLMTNITGTTTFVAGDGKTYLANPGTVSAAGTWGFTDNVLDTQLESQIYAPIGLLNAPPPTGMTNLEFFQGRLWGSVGGTLYYATGPDNAISLNVIQNGVSAESWYPLNFQPINKPIVRSVNIGAGLLVLTTGDTWLETGTSFSTFNATRAFVNVGISNYNAVNYDGSNVYIYSSDRQLLIVSASSGLSELGFSIGDQLELNIDPLHAYVVRHVKGSQDNALYICDGSTGWYRLNPNMPGASNSGETQAIWSPFATITGGLGAVASIETSPGVKTMLCGQVGSGAVLYRDLATFTDNGSAYTWSANIGSIVLATPGFLAETESISTIMRASGSTQCGVAVLLDEISGTFETLSQSTNDPPQLGISSSLLANRFYLAQGSIPPLAQHMQVQFTGTAVATKDEILAFAVRGCKVPEQA